MESFYPLTLSNNEAFHQNRLFSFFSWFIRTKCWSPFQFAINRFQAPLISPWNATDSYNPFPSATKTKIDRTCRRLRGQLNDHAVGCLIYLVTRLRSTSGTILRSRHVALHNDRASIQRRRCWWWTNCASLSLALKKMIVLFSKITPNDLWKLR
jgi:hypothetical protein